METTKERHEHLGSRGFLSDDELAEGIRHLLKMKEGKAADDVTVTVKKGNVKLAGAVRSQNVRDRIVQTVRLMHGLGKVRSELIVKINEGILPTDIGRNP